MDTLKDFLIYVFQYYPSPLELSKARLVKLLYLADWKNALDNGQQLTTIDWYFNHYGPYVDDVMELVTADQRNFRVELRRGSYGGMREVILLVPSHDPPQVSSKARRVLDFVIRTVYPLAWDDFIQLVYSTYPIQTTARYNYLHLVELAQEYRNTGLYSALPQAA